jgi:hypothetical protein
MNFKYLYFRSFLLIYILFSGCVTTPKILFDDPVNTKNKKITIQEKRLFSFEESGIYFSNDFQGARLNDVIKKNDSSFIISILPENEPINPSPFYAFKAWSKSSKNIFLEFNYPDSYKHRYFPKILSEGKWLISDSSSFQELDNKWILELTLDNRPIIISGQELNSSDIVYSWVNEVIRGKETYVTFKKIGKSKLKRPFMVIDIYKGNPEEKPIVVLITRQHPPEVTGYFAFKSYLSTILDENELSSDFLEKYRILAFPLMNPDGVDLGHWRHNAGGIDLNRDWSVYNQKEIKTTVDFISKTLKESNSKLILGIDFHSTFYDVFYTNEERASTSMPYFLDNWFSSLQENIPNYEVNEQPSVSKQPVSKGWFLNAHKAVGIVYEIGDNTPRDRIETIGKESALSMMKIMLD